MIREVRHQVSSICVEERGIDVKEINTIGAIDRIFVELRASPMDRMDSFQKGRIPKRDSIVFQSPSKKQPHDRSRLVPKSFTHPESRFKSKTSLRRESIYVTRNRNHCIGSTSDRSIRSNAAGHRQNQSSSCLVPASLHIRSLRREIELQEMEDRNSQAAECMHNQTSQSIKPSNQYLLSYDRVET
mmetsp:Transcript_22285/g.55057  ORF Transcript_22285/g.55057 Transcript_22285/m.55057 type:complete len:186 (-) Transcript_22285:1610-2167(-)